MDEPEQTMRRYLLGELSESEQSTLEKRYFTEPQVFDQVLKVESELVDSYVRGQMAGEMRERFEKSYMAHPSRRERVKFAATLATGLDQIEEPATNAEQPALPASWWQRLLSTLRGQGPTLRISLALATLLIMLGGVWVWIESLRRQREAAEARASHEAGQRRAPELQQQTTDEGRRSVEESAARQNPVEPGPQQILQPTPTPAVSSGPRSVSLALIVGGVRGGDTSQIPTLVIPPNTTQARLLLSLRGDDYPSYNASLQTVAGAEIYSRRGIKPGRAKAGASFVFTVPARRLESGDYVLTLRGVSPNGEIEELSKSLFRVDKR